MSASFRCSSRGSRKNLSTGVASTARGGPREDGGKDFVWEEVEPVAADVRPRKDESKAKTERRALLRLAAALLGAASTIWRGGTKSGAR